MKGSSYSLRVMKNAKQYKPEVKHGTLLEVPGELERSESSVSKDLFFCFQKFIFVIEFYSNFSKVLIRF